MNQVKQLIKETKKYLTKYDYGRVIECCDKILEIEPHSFFALRFNAIAYSQSGDYQKGLEYYNKLYELSGDDDTRYSIAYINEKLGNYDEALQYYDKNSDSGWVQSKRICLLTNMNCFQTIIDEYDEKLGKHDNSHINDPKIIMEKMFLLEEKAVFQYRNRQYLEAYESFKTVYSLYRSMERELFIGKYNTWYNFLGECLENQGANDFFKDFFNFNNHRDAWLVKINDTLYQYNSIVYPDLLLELNPENLELLGLCAARYKYVEIDYALDCWYKILEIEPDNREAIMEILELYSHQYSKDEALKLIDEKLCIEDIRLDLLSRKIRLLESMTLYDEALSVYDEYLGITGMDDDSYGNLTVFDKIMCMEEMALDYYLEGNLEESFNVLGEVSVTFNKVKNQDDPSFYELGLGDWYGRVLTDSLEQSNSNPHIFFEKYFTVTDKTIDLWIRKIQFLDNNKRLGNPVKYCNILLKKNRNNIRLLLAKAYIYYSRNDYSKALDIYNKVIRLNDDNYAKNYKFNILVSHHQYKKAYSLLESMNAEYGIVNTNLYTLADKLLEKRRYKESLYVYETIYKLTRRVDTVSSIKFLYSKTGDTERLYNCKYYMDWIDLINYKYESDNCPTCGGKLTEILYGYPLPEMMGLADKGEIILGGCCVSDNDPTHYCKCCEKNVYMGTYRIDITNDDPDLAYYTTINIRRLTRYIQEHPDNTLEEIANKALQGGICGQEFVKFIEKLEEIKHIKVVEGNVKIIK